MQPRSSSRNAEPVLRIEGLTKRYGDFTALDDVSFEVAAGEIFALLGPNGAGKTTLISIVAGLTRATAGRAAVLGYDVVRDYRDARRSIGLVPQEVSFDPFFSPLEALRFQRGFFGLGDDPAVYEDILRNLDLWEKRDAYTRTLSGGMKRRLLIAKALVHAPKVLFLDEPTAGVDVALRQDLWRYVSRLRGEGVTVVLTTHYLEEAEELADRIAIIDHGRLLRLEGKRQLMELYGAGTTEIVVEGAVENLPAALAARTVDGRVRLGDEDLGSVLDEVHRAGLRVRDVERRPVRLEDVFLDIIRRPSDPAASASREIEG